MFKEQIEQSHPTIILINNILCARVCTAIKILWKNKVYSLIL